MYTIGLCGASGSGKTTIARMLAEQLDATIIHQDDYFHLPPVRDAYDHLGKNLELPENTDWAKLNEVIRQLQSDGHAHSQTVDWDRERNVPRPIAAKPFLIVEGFLVFFDAQLREMLDLAIYLDVPDAIGMNRRFARNKGDAHREWYETVTYPLYASKRASFAARADLVIDATQPAEAIVRAIIDHAPHGNL